MDDGWADLVHDLTIDLEEMERGQFVLVWHCSGLDPNPYVQAAPDGAAGWYCEVVSEAYLPATMWPIDGGYLMTAGWSPPRDPRDNWSRTADSAAEAALLLAEALRSGRVCPDWRPVLWHTGRFPRPPDDGPEDSPDGPPSAPPEAHRWPSHPRTRPRRPGTTREHRHRDAHVPGRMLVGRAWGGSS